MHCSQVEEHLLVAVEHPSERELVGSSQSRGRQHRASRLVAEQVGDCSRRTRRREASGRRRRPRGLRRCPDCAWRRPASRTPSPRGTADRSLRTCWAKHTPMRAGRDRRARASRDAGQVRHAGMRRARRRRRSSARRLDARTNAFQNPSSRKRPRLRPSSAPTKSTDGSGVSLTAIGVKMLRPRRAESTCATNGLSRRRVLADRHDAALNERRQQLLRVDAELKEAAPDRCRRTCFAERAAVHHAKHGLAGQRHQQAVAVRDDGSRTRDSRAESPERFPDTPSSAAGRVHVLTNAFHGSSRTSYAAPPGFGIVGEDRRPRDLRRARPSASVCAARSMPPRFCTVNRQAVAEHREAQTRTTRHGTSGSAPTETAR